MTDRSLRPERWLAGLGAALVWGSQLHWLGGRPLKLGLLLPALAGAGGFLAGRLWPRPGRKILGWADRLARPRILAELIFFFCLCLYLLFAGGRFYAIDDQERFQTTQALAERHSWRIGTHPDGRPYYAKFGPVQAVLTIPLYAAGKALKFGSGQWAQLDQVLPTALHSLTTAATVVVLFFLVLALGYSRRSALGLALTLGLATLAWPYAKLFFTEPLTALLLLLAVWSAVRFRFRGGGGHLLWAGLALGLAGLNVTLVLVAAGPPLAAYLLWTLWPGRGRAGGWTQTARRFALFALPVLGWVAVMLGFNYFRYGSPWLTGYEGDAGLPNPVYDGAPGFSTPLAVGLFGLLLSPGKSLFLYSPPLLAALAGLRGWAGRFKAEAALILGLSLLWLGLYAKWWAWHGDLAWGPRYALPLTGLLLLPLAEAWRRWAEIKTRTKMVIAGLILAGLAVQAAAVLAPFDLYLSQVFKPDYSNLPELHYFPQLSPWLGQFKVLPQLGRPDVFLYKTPLAYLLGSGAAVLGWLLALGWAGAEAELRNSSPAPDA